MSGLVVKANITNLYGMQEINLFLTSLLACDGGDLSEVFQPLDDDRCDRLQDPRDNED